jgi:hypothetical protein
VEELEYQGWRIMIAKGLEVVGASEVVDNDPSDEGSSVTSKPLDATTPLGCQEPTTDQLLPSTTSIREATRPKSEHKKISDRIKQRKRRKAKRIAKDNNLPKGKSTSSSGPNSVK